MNNDAGKVVLRSKARIPNDEINENALKESFSGNNAPPTIFVSNDVPRGFRLLGSAHAAAAWELRHGSSPEYSPQHFVFVNPNEFENIRQIGESLTITESALDKKEVAVALDAEAPALKNEPKRPESNVLLKMYIAVRDGVPIERLFASVANGIVQCCRKYKDDADLTTWANSSFAKVIVRANEKEFEKAKKAGDYIAISGPDRYDEEVLVFKPRQAWDKVFNFMRLCK